jgi:hypothetical protein
LIPTNFMISEVARSSANVSFGGHTRWANFFHGFFLLVAMLLFIPVIEMIPNAALAALLIAVGYRLASPKEFYKTYKIGAEQLVVFITTVIVTVSTDLLIGVGSGILMKFLFHILNGAPLRSLFKPRYELSESEYEYFISIKDAAIFSNLIGFKKMFARIRPGKKVTINFSDARIVDHTFMETLHHFEEEYHNNGGQVIVTGFEHFQFFSNHPLAARKFSKDAGARIEIKLSPRQIDLRKLADKAELNFYPQKVRNALKYKDFPIQRGNKVLYEENLLTKYIEAGKLEVSDITLSEGARQAQEDTHITAISVSELDVNIPDFALEPEGLWSKFSELAGGKDIDFHLHPTFSKKYYLRSDQEETTRNFFSDGLIRFFENHEDMHVECHRHRLLIYKKRGVLEPSEIKQMIHFVEELLSVIQETSVQHA